ncbi:MAG: hypothetical protein HOH43_07275 [Candidatus Latescibacteria bacterium]|nr:hypothetical protein [Candidatus Latescibacterota bacterium]
MKPILWISFALIGAWPDLSCEPAKKVDSGPVVARVNETVLTTGDMQTEMQTVVLPAATSQMQQEWVQEWIQSELIYQEALRLGLDQDEELSREVQRMQRDYLVNVFLERKLAEESREVSPADMDGYYEEHKEDFVRQEPEFRLSVIVLPTEGDAREVWRNLVRGRADFGEIARSRSQDVISAQKDGDLGYLKPGDIIDPDFRDIVFAMRVGDLSRAVPTESGYCIIQVTDAHESGSVRELEEVRGEIVNRVLEERRKNRIKELVDGLRVKADVEVDRTHIIRQMRQEPASAVPETQE